MATGQDQILGSDSVRDALKTKVNDDFSEVFSSVSSLQSEVQAARDGKPTLLEKEQEQDTAILALSRGDVTLISSNDTTPGFLNGKLVAGNGIVLTENNDGGNESLSVHAGILTGLTAGEDLLARDPVAINSEDGKVYKFRTFSEAFIDNLPEGAASGYGTVDIAVLDSTHVAVAYRRGSDSYGRVVVGEIQDDKTIDWGTPVTFNSANTLNISIVALTSSLFVVAYKDGGNSGYGTAVACSVSGTTIIAGSETVFWSSNYIDYTDICRLDDSHFFIGFQGYDGSNTCCRSVAGSVSGTTISFGTAVTANTGSFGNYVKVDSLDSTHAVIQDYHSGGTLRIAEINLSTNAISYPTANTNVTNRYGDVVALDSTHFVSPYYASNTFTLYLYSVSGTTITEEDSQTIYTNANSNMIQMFKIDSTRVGAFFGENGGTTTNFCLITCSSDEIESWENIIDTFLSTSAGTRGAMIDDAKFIEISGDGYQIQDINLVFSALAGFVNDDITSGNDADVYYTGVMTGFSGLSPGRTYYLDGDGTLKLSLASPEPETNYRAGIAKSATELLIQL